LQYVGRNVQGFDETSGTLDTVSAETQKVVISSMEEEVHNPVQKNRRAVLCFVLVVLYIINKHLPFLYIQDYSSSVLHALSSHTDSGDTCSSGVPGKRNS
jgi:hypothetical protein